MGRNKHKTIKFNRIIRSYSFFQTENDTFKQNLLQVTVMKIKVLFFLMYRSTIFLICWFSLSLNRYILFLLNMKLTSSIHHIQIHILDETKTTSDESNPMVTKVTSTLGSKVLYVPYEIVTTKEGKEFIHVYVIVMGSSKC